MGATHLLGARVFSLQRNGSSEAGCRCCWLASEAGCRCCWLASLHCASLECASLECASLECASLECASLSALEGGCSQLVCDWFACDWFVCDWLAMVLASAHALSSHQLATCTPWRYRSHRCARDIRHSSCEEAAIKRGGKNSAISDVSLSRARSVCVCVSFSLCVCSWWMMARVWSCQEVRGLSRGSLVLAAPAALNRTREGSAQLYSWLFLAAGSTWKSADLSFLQHLTGLVACGSNIAPTRKLLLDVRAPVASAACCSTIAVEVRVSGRDLLF